MLKVRDPSNMRECQVMHLVMRSEQITEHVMEAVAKISIPDITVYVAER